VIQKRVPVAGIAAGVREVLSPSNRRAERHDGMFCAANVRGGHTIGKRNCENVWFVTSKAGLMTGRLPTPGMSGRGVRQAYLIGALILIALYPLLPVPARHIDFLVVFISAIPAVAVGLRAIPRSRRRPWHVLLVALIVINLGAILRLLPGDAAFTASTVLDAAGNALVLVAALAQVLRLGSGSLGGIIDTIIVALAFGGLLWDVVLLPNLVDSYHLRAQQVNLFVVVFALSGVLGALARLLQITHRRVPALWQLMVALALALVGNIVYAVGPLPWHRTTASMMFMGAFAALGLFGLEPSATQIAQPQAVLQKDELSVGRLVFLSLAVAATPVVVGIRVLFGADVDGVLLVVGGATIAVLVMVRIGQLSAARDRAERALRFEASHDHLTGLPNRREFLDQLSNELKRSPQCVLFFCDLDGFKSVNDRLGHETGDELLVEVGQRLRACVRQGDVVSRFGGDEFLILLRDQAPSVVSTICRRIADALSRPIRLQDEQVSIGASIGIALAAGESDADALIRRADRAMYKAKRDEPTVPGIRIVSV
jgi:diguanylate cyclase (GGDEF)-like protein